MKMMLKYLAVPVILVLVFQFNGCKEDDPLAEIASVSPTSGAAGATVTITGSFFETNAADNIVKFNGATATVTAASATELTVTVPAEATTGKITVSVRDATATSPTDFIVIDPITITSFTPTGGKLGATVTITGDNFGPTIGGNVVKFNGTTATVIAATKTELKVTLSSIVSTGKITVTAGGVTGTSAIDFTYIPSWVVSDLAGSGVNGSGNGTGTSASFSNMTNIAIDSVGNVYMADELNHLIRKITPSGVATTIAGTSQGYADGPVATAMFDNPVAIAVDATGNIYVADSFNNMIRKISTSGMVTTIAGTKSGGANNGTGTDASFNNPHGVCVDNTGNLFIADNLNNMIRKITPAGVVTTFAGDGTPGSVNGTGTAARLYNPWGLTIDKNNNLYIADTFGNKIRKITPAGVVTTLAGADFAGSVDGQGSAARFDRPTGVSADHKGNVFVADHFGSTVRMITSTGLVTTIAGAPSATAYVNGPGELARFFNPYSVTTNAAGTIVYVADQGNRRVRKMEIK
ncbi:MAG TPA: IPT/TIG domain-containing protein [Cyclobacteriaceae bacterium]|nr:IPT/TIG domain-containing protein [Cyclobacteriaceae bacterium]